MKEKLACVHFGRGGSKGIPGKNTMPILGRPAMTYALIAAKNSKHVQQIYISSDSEEIFSVARSFDAIEIHRPAELCSDSALLQDAILHAAKTVVAKDPETTHLSITMCNCPNIIASTIDAAYEKLLNNSDLDSVISVARYEMFSPERARTLNSDGKTLSPYVSFENFNDKVTCDRKSHRPTYFADGGVTVVKIDSLWNMSENLLPFQWMGKSIGHLEQIPGGGDIDFPWQIKSVEWWLEQNGFSNTTTPHEKACV